jgi:hypothetical protein
MQRQLSSYLSGSCVCVRKNFPDKENIILYIYIYIYLFIYYIVIYVYISYFYLYLILSIFMETQRYQTIKTIIPLCLGKPNNINRF